LASGNLFGQDNKQKQDEQLKKEVQVVRPYEPSIPDAFKINLQPKVEDTLKIAPNFSYSILQRPLITSFSVTPISAARMLQEQPLPLHSTYLKMGYGNYNRPCSSFTSTRNAAPTMPLGLGCSIAPRLGILSWQIAIRLMRATGEPTCCSSANG
jgi:hypothetical protein